MASGRSDGLKGHFRRDCVHVQRFMAKYELCSPYTLCCSDCEPLTMSEALELADGECKNM